MATSATASIDRARRRAPAAGRRGSTRAERRLTLTPEAALALAIERHGAGALDDAELLYAKLIERWPEQPDVLNHYGRLRHQRGDHAGALALLRRAAAAAPNHSGIWNNLGNALLRNHGADEAEQAFRRSIAIDDNPQAQSNLSRVLRRRGQWAESEAACRRAIELAPELADGWHNLSLALLGQRCIDEGVRAASKALTLLPAAQRRRDSYARALVLLGETERAAAIYREWLADDPESPYLLHHLAACGDAPAPPRASDAYVEQVFDDFAESFDAKLAQLQYRAPQWVAAALAKVLAEPAQQYAIADLGCGTGLCGPLVAPWAHTLAGCDLSGAMLVQARDRGVYHAIEKAELVQYLDANPAAFDVVLSADTFCYFGDLHAAARTTRAALRPQGWFVFTVEALADDDAAPFRLRPNGRYAHAPSHLAAALGAAGLACRATERVVLRHEGGLPVDGWLVTAQG